MGIDCMLRINDERIDLSRWYVFDHVFISGQKVQKKEAIDKLEKLLVSVEEDTEEYDWSTEGGVEHRELWIKKAIADISKADDDAVIAFFSDLHDEYYA